MSETKRGGGRVLLVALLAAVLVAVLGGLATDIGSWYVALVKPSWQPPDAWFGPVWTVIFALLAMAAALSWWGSPDRVSRQNLLIWLLLNVVLNVGWSLLFFRLRRPDWALSEVALLWLSIAILVWVCWKRSRLASILLIPYLAWVSFAAVLNWEIVRLNGPFSP